MKHGRGAIDSNDLSSNLVEWLDKEEGIDLETIVEEWGGQGGSVIFLKRITINNTRFILEYALFDNSITESNHGVYIDYRADH